MALVMCPLCTSEDDVHVLETLPDGRRRVGVHAGATSSGSTEVRRPARPSRGAGTTLLAARAKFPTAAT